MRETKTYCDHCGRALSENHDYHDQEVGIISYQTADLCSLCVVRLETLIKSFCNKEEGESDA